MAIKRLSEMVEEYNILMGSTQSMIQDNPNRRSGGVIRSAKGKYVEEIPPKLVTYAWESIGGDISRLDFTKRTQRLPINPEYLASLDPSVSRYINGNIVDYFYTLKADVHVNIDKKFVVGIECKAYTENAMLKRILVDFQLMRKLNPSLKCVLLQLESQLTGDYSNVNTSINYGSRSSHTLMSYFDYPLEIITLLEGERKVDEPIHEIYKPLTEFALQKAVNKFQNILTEFI